MSSYGTGQDKIPYHALDLRNQDLPVAIVVIRCVEVGTAPRWP